jgi:hypothetical protein
MLTQKQVCLNTRSKIFSFLIIILFSSCCKTDKIIITCGLSQNPDEKRYGIEINSNSDLFYCEEIKPQKGNYNYYYCKVDSQDFETLIKAIKEEFNLFIGQGDIVDATQYQLNIFSDDHEKILLFYQTFLNDKQNSLINKIIELKNQKFIKINYHYFPQNLLTEKLPPPPPRP